MNVIPIAPSPAPAALAGAASGSDGSAATLVDTFAALVGALTVELVATEAVAPEEGATEGELDDAAADGAWDEEQVPAMDVPALLAAGAQPAPTRPEPASDAPGEAATDPGQPVPVTGAPSTGSATIEAGAPPHTADVAPPQPSPQSPPPGPDEPPTIAGADEPVAVAPGPVDEGPAEPQGPSDDTMPTSGHEVRSADAPQAGLDAPPAGEGAPASVVVAGSARVAPAAGPAVAAPADADVQASLPSLPDQLVEVIRPVRHAPDGTHRVSVQLRPDELGEVLVDVRVRGHEVSLHIRADLAGTAELLRDAVSELRAELDAAGFRSADVDVSSHADRGSGQDQRPVPGDVDRISPNAPPRSPLDEGTGVDPTAAATSGLDVRL